MALAFDGTNLAKGLKNDLDFGQLLFPYSSKIFNRKLSKDHSNTI
jgi:hypothetical protein